MQHEQVRLSGQLRNIALYNGKNNTKILLIFIVRTTHISTVLGFSPGKSKGNQLGQRSVIYTVKVE